jgi:hypothetical protein
MRPRVSVRRPLWHAADRGAVRGRTDRYRPAAITDGVVISSGISGSTCAK